MTSLPWSSVLAAQAQVSLAQVTVCRAVHRGLGCLPHRWWWDVSELAVALQGEGLSSQPVPAEHGAGEMALVIKVHAALGSVGGERKKTSGASCNCRNLLSTLPYCCLWWGWKCGNWKRPRRVEELPCKEQQSKWGQSCRAMTSQRLWVGVNSLSLPAWELEDIDESTTHAAGNRKQSWISY